MKKAFIPKWGYYTIGGFIISILLIIGSLKIKSQNISNIKELERIKIEDRLQYERNRERSNLQWEKDKIERYKVAEFERKRQKEEDIKEAPNKRKKLLERGFNMWNGSHIKLEKYIKTSLKDPRSYEHIETRYTDKGDFIIVGTKFRARNGFGGMVIGNIAVKASIDGDILELIIKDF
jgi:hypothetical protein